MAGEQRTPIRHQGRHASTGSDPITGLLDANARLAVDIVGGGSGTRRKLRFAAGTGPAITVADDAGNELVTVTVSLAGFTGLLAKDHDEASREYLAGQTATLVTYDVGVNAWLQPARIRLPPTTHADLRTIYEIEYDDASTSSVENTDTAAVLDETAQSLADTMMGAAGSAAANNGKRPQKVRFKVQNVGIANLTADLDPFRLRAYVHARGAGAAL